MTAPAPVRTYNETLLDVIAPNSRDFARTWVRMLLRDRPEIDRGGVPVSPGQPLRPREATWPEFSRTDQELNAALELDALSLELPMPDGGVQVARYYRPHFTAARLYLGDPNLWKSRSVDGTSESRRDAWEIVRAWLSQGASLDAMLPAGLHPLPPFEEQGKVAADGVTEEPYIPYTPYTVRGI